MDDYKIFKRDPETGRISLTPPFPPKKVSGLDKLVQAVIIALLSDPGRNAMYPTLGSGLPSLIGSNIDPSDPTEILADVTQRIEKIKNELLDAQNSLENEDASERLRELVILNVETGTNIDEVIVIFKVVSEAGSSTNLVI